VLAERQQFWKRSFLERERRGAAEVRRMLAEAQDEDQPRQQENISKAKKVVDFVCPTDTSQKFKYYLTKERADDRKEFFCVTSTKKAEHLLHATHANAV